MSPDESILRQLLGIGVILHETHRDRENFGVIALHDFHKSSLFTGEKAAHQRLIDHCIGVYSTRMRVGGNRAGGLAGKSGGGGGEERIRHGVQ